MVQVSLTSSLRSAVEGADILEIEARTIRELLSVLVERYPRMQKHIDAGIAVAIDGDIYRDKLDVSIPAKSEVFLLPRIAGG
jgi:molybdopterin synthase sulfur carrier subunit